MSHTILSTTAYPEHVAPRPSDSDYLKVTRRAYSIDGYAPVLVTIRIGKQGKTAWIESKALWPGESWREPNAKQRRMLVDHELYKVGLARDGAVLHIQGWSYSYPLKRV